MRPILDRLHGLRRRLLIHRRGIAALCAGLAVLLLVQVFRPPAPETVPVWVVTRDVPVGEALVRDDLRRARWPTGVGVRGVDGVDGLVGRTVIVPLERGQPLSERQVLGAPALVGYPGRTAVAIRLPDPDVVDLLDPGEVIDLWITGAKADAQARAAVEGAVVVAVPEADEGPLGAASGQGRLVVLAVEDDEVAVVAAAATSGFLSVAWRR